MNYFREKELELLKDGRIPGMIGNIKYMKGYLAARSLPDYSATSISDIVNNVDMISPGESVYVADASIIKMNRTTLILHDFKSDIDVYANPNAFYRSTSRGIHPLMNFEEAISNLPNQCRVYEIVMKKNDRNKMMLHSIDFEVRIDYRQGERYSFRTA